MTFEMQVTEHAFSFRHIADTASKQVPYLKGYFKPLLFFTSNKAICKKKKQPIGVLPS